jgi:hypothetical protein
MKKLAMMIAIGALAVGMTAAPGAIAKKAPKQVSGTVSVAPTPTTITPETTTVTVTGNVASNSSCRKGRTVRFSYVNGTTVTPLAETAVTTNNGSYSAVLPKPTDAAPASVTLRATVDSAIRKVGSKKKGKKAKKGRAFNCLEITGDSTALTVSEPLPV